MFVTSVFVAASVLMDFNVFKYKHIVFDSIPPTNYRIDGDHLIAEVDSSSSFLLVPFDRPENIKKVSFEWRTSGSIQIADSAGEQTKSGDDAQLRVGFLLVGRSIMLPFLVPNWITLVRDQLLIEADRLLYLIVGAKSRPGTYWPSPYAGSTVTIKSIASQPATQAGWLTATEVFDDYLSVAGLWIMADGDNTKSKFRTELKRLVFER